MPYIEADIKALCGCVGHLYTEAGSNGAAGTVVNAFGQYLESKPEKIHEAYEISLQKPDGERGLLLCIIISGVKHDFPRYYSEILRLVDHADTELRQTGLCALGRISYTEHLDKAQQALEVLGNQASIINGEDEHYSAVVDSLLRLSPALPDSETRIREHITKCMNSGELKTVNAASSALAYSQVEYPLSILKAVLIGSTNVPAKYQSIHMSLDHICEKILDNQVDPPGIEKFFERLLDADREIAQNFSKIYHGVTEKLLADNRRLLSLYSSRWFLKGNRRLCELIASVASSVHDNDVFLHADLSELADISDEAVLFVARKAIGYFAVRPLTASSYLLSLVPLTKNIETNHKIQEYFFEFLVVNYPGSVIPYLEKNLTDSSDVSTKKMCLGLLQQYKSYVAGLKAADGIVELCPSTDMRYVAHQHQAKWMGDIWENAQAESIFAQLCTRNVILYGNSTINYIEFDAGKSRKRVETPLHPTSTEFELPRLLHLNAPMLDHTLSMFCVERYEP